MTLRVRPISAHLETKSNSFFQISSYLLVYVGQQGKRTRSDKSGNLNPHWNLQQDILIFHINKYEDHFLLLQLIDEGIIKQKLMGQGRLQIKKFTKNSHYSSNQNLQLNFGLQKIGNVYLNIQYNQGLNQKQNIYTHIQGQRIIMKINKGFFYQDLDFFGKMDPFCQIIYSKQKKKSKTHKEGGKHPIWNQSFEFILHKNDRSVQIAVYDQDFSNNELLGNTSMEIEKLLDKQGIEDVEVELWKNNKKAGIILVSIFLKIF